jgi:hypothetical protein
MSGSLISLAYFSRNSLEGSPEQLQEEIASILVSARRNNALRGVTGALLFSDGCFAQVLEGRQEDVEAIFEAIQCDIRHCEVTIMHAHPVEARSFGDWSMAFGGVDGISIDPKIQADGMGPVEGILAIEAGINLLATLRSVVRRNDMGRF